MTAPYLAWLPKLPTASPSLFPTCQNGACYATPCDIDDVLPLHIEASLAAQLVHGLFAPFSRRQLPEAFSSPDTGVRTCQRTDSQHRFREPWGFANLRVAL